MPRERWLTTTEAARRLGVRRETVYAYVSRGQLPVHRAADGRRSRFAAADVAKLAARSRKRGQPGGLELVVDTAITLLDPGGRLWYRGWDVEEACRSASFEGVTEWLWSNFSDPAQLAQRTVVFPYQAPSTLLQVARAAVATLPETSLPIERLRTAVAAAPTADPLRFDRRPGAVAATGRRILTVATASLDRGEVPVEGASPSVAGRLFRSLGGRPPSGPEELRALDGALVVLADHELASSTLAARVAASTWADPYLVVLAGLAVIGGPLHGGVGDRVAAMVRRAVASGPAAVVGEELRDNEFVPGFGHLVYEEHDPRADALLGLVRAAWPDEPAVGAGDEIVRLVADGGGTFPNVDLALGVLVAAGGFTEGAAEAVFATARIAGWLAHAAEEYEHRLRYRTRAVYTGREPPR